MDAKNNSMATIIFCSHLCVGEDVRPLEPKEWSNLADTLLCNNIQPFELLDISVENFQKFSLEEGLVLRLDRLIARSASIAFELEKLDNIGIQVVTQSDSLYPQKLKKTLGKACPPLFYCAGSLELLDQKLLGVVGSRTVDIDDLNFVKTIVGRAVKKGCGIVSGGAKGVDSIATAEAIAKGGFAVEFLSDSMMKKIKHAETVAALRDGKLLLISVSKPDAGFNAGLAMMRNKYIYAVSNATVVVKSDYNKGGTWSGAVENLKKSYSTEFCREVKGYNGNTELIKLGAIPIDENWDVNTEMPPKPLKIMQQLSLW